MRIRTLIFFILSLLSYNLNAQGSYSDFLHEDDIHSKAEMGLELWNVYARSYQDSVKVVAVELLMDASEKEDEFARAVGTRILGSHLYKSGKIEQGLEYMISSRDYFVKHEDYVTASELYNEVGNALYKNAEYDEAIEAYRKSIQYGKQSTDPTAEYNGELGMGRSYIAKGDTNVGMNFIHNYKRLAIEQRKYEAAADALAFLAMIEELKGNLNISMEYYYRSMEFSRRSRSKIHLSHSYANMGIVKFFSEDYDSSLFYFEASLELRKSLNNTLGIIEGYVNLGDFYSGIGKNDLAIENYVTSRELANKNGFIDDEIYAIEMMIEVYKAEKKPEKVEQLTREKEALEKQKENQKGLDEDIINSIDLEFTKKNEETQKKNEGILGWKELTIGLLILGLLILFLSERRRIS